MKKFRDMSPDAPLYIRVIIWCLYMEARITGFIVGFWR